MKKAYLFEKLNSEKRVKCLNCSHYCIIGPNERGLCIVRENIDGELYVLNYSKAVAINIDPIEKKPFFHFLPGTNCLSIAAAGCNFKCLNCQNYDISQGFKRKGVIPGKKISAQKVVEMAVEKNLPSISYTYTEPTVFLEYALDTMKKAKKKKIKNSFVSNGFLSKESAQAIIPYLDAINIDIKSFSDDFYRHVCSARLEPVLRTAELMKKSGVWVEITTLIIPSLSDSEKMLENIAEFINKKLGPETPWHVTGFSGKISYKLNHLPDTSVDTLKKAYEIGKSSGLKYVYTGNIPGLPSEDTFCPECQSLMVDRTGYNVFRYDEKGFCSKCKINLNLIL